jgi:hypothetical protein
VALLADVLGHNPLDKQALPPMRDPPGLGQQGRLVQVGQDGAGGPAPGHQSTLDGGRVAVVAADVAAGPEPDRAG